MKAGLHFLKGLSASWSIWLRKSKRPESLCISPIFRRAVNDLKLSIDDKINRGLVRRTIEASNDAGDIVKAFRTIANLVSICTVCYFGSFLLLN
jgi:hypothetical protein